MNIFSVKKPNIIVIGDMMLDHNIYGSIEKIANEAPIPVLHKSSELYTLGGCGNVLMNVDALGCNKLFILSMIGNDSYGDIIKGILNEKNISTALIKKDTTIVKHRFFCNNKIIFRYDDENIYDLSEEDENYIYKSFVDIINNNTIDSVIFSDYNKGFLTNNICKKIIELANIHKIFTFVDPKNNYVKYKNCSLIKPNRNEVRKLFNIDINDNNINEVLINVKNMVQSKHVIITLSDKGISYIDDNNKIYNQPTAALDVIDVTGAGDIVNAIVSYYLPLYNKEYVIKLSSYIATKSVSSLGTYVIKKEDILYANKHFNENKLLDLEYTKYLSKPIIFTNGCFDILHKGHIELFNYCKTLIKDGILIVGLNSDESIRKLKGQERPINNLDTRIYMLSSLSMIDYIIVFNEDTPYELLKVLQPHTLVKGGDYILDTIIGKEFCKNINIFNTIQGYSTTNIISKIKSPA